MPIQDPILQEQQPVPERLFDKAAWGTRLRTVEKTVLRGYISARIEHLRGRMESAKLEDVQSIQARIAELRDLSRLLETGIEPQPVKENLYG